jgi:MFS family permease
VCGGGIAVAAVATGDIVGLVLGMVLLGLGNAGAQLSRYAAAELYPPHRRGLAIGIVVWAGTVGAVGGPLLLDPSGHLATAFGRPAFTGPFLLAALAAAGAMVASRGAPGRTTRAIPSRVPLRDLAATGTARSALAVMVTAQVVMVAVMTAAPLDMHMHGEGLTSVGMTLSAHTLGMFALSPLTGRLLDRIGARHVMLAGLATLVVASGLAAVGADGHAIVRTAALFLLGYGWNLCFVGGSGRLSRDLSAADRARVEGAVDAAVWGVAAGASTASTAIMSAGGYAALAGLACVLAALPAAFLVRDDRLRTS